MDSSKMIYQTLTVDRSQLTQDVHKHPECMGFFFEDQEQSRSQVIHGLCVAEGRCSTRVGHQNSVCGHKDVQSGQEWKGKKMKI